MKYKQTNINVEDAAEPGFYDEDGVWNAIKIVDGKPYRDRLECLIIGKDDKSIYLWLKPDGTYKIPGGSKELNVSDKQQIINECKEEARIIIKDVVNSEVHTNHPEDMPKWAIDKNMKKWYGKYTTIYVAKYNKPYTGYISPLDRDDKMLKNGKFYPISRVSHILTPTHRYVLKKMGYIVK